MRKDAVVLEIRKKTAVVLASDGRFLRVRNQGYHVGQRIAETEQTPVRLRPMLRRTLLIAACFVLVLGSSALAASKYLVWSYAGVDVGDISVNYTLNFRNEVLSAEGNSEEAEQLIGSLEKIPYEPVDSAVERMMDVIGKKQQEESEEPEIVISVASFMGGTGRMEDGIMEGIDRSAEKSRPDEPREKRHEEIRVERLEWQDAGQFMDDRHQPQNAQNPAEPGKERQLPEETKLEAPEKQPESQSTDVPQSTPATSVKTDEPPAQNPAANPQQQGNSAQEPVISGQDQQEPGNNPPDAENPAGKPVEDETGSAQEKHISEDPNSSQQKPASQDSPGQQPSDSPAQKPADNPAQQPADSPGQQSADSPGQQPVDNPPENDMQGQSEPENRQKPQGSDRQSQAQPSQPQSAPPQQAPGSDNTQMNPGEQNRPDNGGNPSPKR